MVTAARPTFAETRLIHEKRLEIAEAGAARFEPDGSWQQDEWCSCTDNAWSRMTVIELHQWQDRDANCFCLGAATRIETQRAIPEILDVFSAGGCDEGMARLYANAADIEVADPPEAGPRGDPAIDAIIEWSDAPGRTIDGVRHLAAGLVVHCQNPVRLNLSGRRVIPSRSPA